MALAAASGKSCDMGGMDHDAMPGMDHGKMDHMDHGDMKPADAETMNCKEMCAMMKKSSDAPPADEKPAAEMDHSQH